MAVTLIDKGENGVKQRTKYLVIGSLAGIANGLFGSGGGLFLVPLLTAWTGMDQKRAFATSVAVVVPLSLVSLAVFYLKGGGAALWNAWPYVLGGAAGGVIAGRVFGSLSTTALRRVFGVLLIYGGIRAVLLL